jgi:hypothetical protein
MTMTRRDRVAIITTRGDAHLPYVEKHLKRPSLILDPRELLEATPLTYRFKEGSIEVVYKGELLDDIAGVWYRKPMPILRRELPVKHEYRPYVQESIERHAQSWTIAFPKAVWVSDYYDLVRASDKPLQLALAQQIGFRVPPTIVSSDPAEVNHFLRQRPDSVTKPLVPAYPLINGERRLLFTTRIGGSFTPDLSNLYLAPSIFQEAVDLLHEVRVTVIGDRVFPAIVRSDLDKKNGNAARLNRILDNKVGYYKGTVRIEAMKDLPADIAEKCITHTARLNLKFGALDIILDKKGTWWFLENNPNGQWAYIEEATGLPIGKALADLLQGKQ